MKHGFELSSGALLVLACVYFFGGITSLVALLAAIIVHEAGHAAAIIICGGRVRGVRADSSGLCMSQSGAYGTATEIITLLAGPAGGLALALLCAHIGQKWSNVLFLRTAGMSLLLTAYNLLPALPLDGGRALMCVLNAIFGAEKAGSIMFCISLAVGLLLAILGMCSADTGLGAALITAGVWVLIAQTGIVKSMRLM